MANDGILPFLNRKARRAAGLPSLGKRRLAHCHEMLKSVAHAAAMEHYEVLMSASNFSFDQWKLGHPDLSGSELQRAFADEHWGKYLAIAKATLGSLLADPTIAENLKEDIFHALALDNSLQRGRANVGPPSAVLNPALGAAMMEKK